VKKVIAFSIATTYLLFAGGDMVPVVEPVVTVPMEEVVNNKSWFVGMSGGYVGLDVSQTPANAIATNFIPEFEGVSYGVELGYDSGNLFYTINYDYLDIDHATMQNITASINYKMGMFYAGVVAGMSAFEWDQAPTATFEADSDEAIYGVQVGFQADITNHLSVYVQYRYLQTEHTTTLTNGATQSEVLYENINNAVIGVRYYFSGEIYDEIKIKCRGTQCNITSRMR